MPSPVSPDDVAKQRLRCRVANCAGHLMNVDLSAALAFAVHQGLTGAPETFATCDRCGRKSIYTYTDLLHLLPPDRQPADLPTGFVLAVLVARYPRPSSASGESFLGERVLVALASVDGDEWFGTLKSSSFLAPSLPIGTALAGRVLGDHTVVFGRVVDDRIEPLPLEAPTPGTTDTGFFYVPDASPDTLLAANLFCANPSCPHIFGPYYSQTLDMMRRAAATPRADNAFVIFTCERCGTSRVVSEASFDGLFKA